MNLYYLYKQQKDQFLQQIQEDQNQLKETKWIQKILFECCENNEIEILKKLIESNKELINSLDINNKTLLMNCFENNCYDCAIFLRNEMNCRVDLFDKVNNTIFHSIAKMNMNEKIQPMIVELIKEYNGLLYKKNVYNENPLIYAIKKGNIEYVNFLIDVYHENDLLSFKETIEEYLISSEKNTKELIELFENYWKKKEKEIEINTETKEIEIPQQQVTKQTETKTQPKSSFSFFNNLFTKKEDTRKQALDYFEQMVNELTFDEKLTIQCDSYNTKNKFRILSMDGGGIKCLLQTVILDRILQKYPTFLDNVNLLCGVSASSFICCDLALGIKPRDICKLLSEMFKHMFEKKSHGFTSASYSPEYILQVCQMTYKEKKLSDLQRNICIHAFQFDSGKDDPERRCHACTFNNFIPGHDCSIIDACMRSSAAVGYFPPYQGYADGGIYDNNPCTGAFPYVFGEEGFGADRKNTVCLSLSAGRPPEMYMDIEKYADPGMFQIMPIMMDGFFWSRREMADEVAKGYLGERYMRFDPVLHEKLDLDRNDETELIIALANSIDITPLEQWIEKYWF